MILFPAIDLKNGQCVRLEKGDMDRTTIFNDDPADQAEKWQDLGFSWIHVVDLNGAFAGQPVNGAAVKAILDRFQGPIQLGGGIRDRKTIDQWLEKGIRRVILGTVALRDPALVKEACRAHPGRVVVGLDARGGKLAVEGWAETTDRMAVDVARSFEDAGVAAIVYTDIDRDGVMTGPNIDATAALADAITIPVIASGGVSSLQDLLALKKRAHPRIEGVISGRALYDGRINPRQALSALADGGSA